ncbi:carbamoyl-phosphate synthase (glutamine-hydrolyzing) cpa2 [Linnemannia schmuckeri]|uniref:Carbamoyl-phosphate synthase (Glutamine-hydrolyzing) cpa2 n=1 Tax=Linnemannia schmuckeri TaxID=64567 RepID=A0A9P5RWP6_9FUNG|nr:carbamoyl-phosphate synthase (glutamine-hydrolyzing) cpa2 [Linnemannia schmuckeri]
MRRTWTTATVALSCAVLCIAYPQPIDTFQQHTFTPGHHGHHNINNNDETIQTYARFDGEQVLRFDVSNLAQLKLLQNTVEKENLDLWSNLRIGTVDLRVPASKIDTPTVKAITDAIPSTVMIPDLQDLIPTQSPALTLLERPNINENWNFTDNSFWHQYHDFATLNNFTETMVHQYPDLVKRVSIGKTFEGREIFGMSIHGFKQKKDKKDKKKKKKKSKSWFFADDEDDFEDYEGNDDEQDTIDMDESTVSVTNEKGGDIVSSWWSWLFNTTPRQSIRKPSRPKKHPKAIVLHAAQHARGYHHNKKITRLLDQFEFVIVPVLNADGYVYTWEHNRMWRKNRQPTSIPLCPGIDPNRNWGYMYGGDGSSANPCNEGYHGPEAFAALESKMMANFILDRKNVVAYIDFHAYSQLWMSPFGGDCSQVPKDDEDLMEGGMGAAKALHDVHGKKFSVGSICNVIYQASGGSIDWTYAVGKVKYSYGVELRDTGRYGFMLPEAEILPSSEETMAGVMYLANFIRKREKQWGFK